MEEKRDEKGCVVSSRDEARGCNECQCTRETRLGPLKTSYSPIWSHHIEFSWDTCEASCIQMRCFEVL